MRVLVVEDHPLTREGLSLAARAALPGVQVVCVGSIAEAVTAMANGRGFRLVLLDFMLPDSHGYAGMLRLQQLDSGVPVVIVTAHERLNLVEAARSLGAAGFLLKSEPLDEVASVLRRIAGGATHFPANVCVDSTITAARARIADLSRAQYAVLLELADGRANKQIAYNLSITEATVKAHLTVIYRKLRVTNRSQALLAIRPLLQIESDARSGSVGIAPS